MVGQLCCLLVMRPCQREGIKEKLKEASTYLAISKTEWNSLKQVCSDTFTFCRDTMYNLASPAEKLFSSVGQMKPDLSHQWLRAMNRRRSRTRMVTPAQSTQFCTILSKKNNFFLYMKGVSGLAPGCSKYTFFGGGGSTLFCTKISWIKQSTKNQNNDSNLGDLSPLRPQAIKS